jgi:signal transduction histidine kinase
MRTPLNGIVGFVDVLQETVQTDELKTYVSYLAKSAARLEKFAADAILISELTVGDYQLYESEFNISELIAEIEVELEEEIGVKGLRLVFEPVGSTSMFSDRNLVSIALRHILENAVKYSPAESKIAISSVDDDAMVAQIQIADNGPGFSRPALENLFSLFSIGQEHIDNSCGLGLALTNMIMQNLNGRISVNNRNGGGACVNLFSETYTAITLRISGASRFINCTTPDWSV